MPRKSKPKPPELSGPQAGQMMCQQIVCCPRCQSPLARECCDSKINEMTGVRTIRGYCEHCGVLAIGRYRLGNGLWNLDGEVECLADPCEPRFKSFLKRIAALRGDRQQGGDRTQDSALSKSTLERTLTQHGDATPADLAVPGAIYPEPLAAA
jgi:hypothetical protein